MTIGQRIAALRKGQQLSQEELGQLLGVSRQAIYKWESDASLPEIDKLIALSKRFGLPVGQLLGVEEPAETADEGGGADALAAGPLDALERILARYQEENQRQMKEAIEKELRQRAPLSKKQQTRNSVMFGILFGACCLMALLVFSLMGKVNSTSAQYEQLQMSLQDFQVSIHNEVDGIAYRVEAAMKAQGELTAGYDCALQSTDPAAQTAVFAVSAVPKTYTDGMRAVFYAETREDAHGERVAVEGRHDGQTFSAELTCPLSDTITLGVTFIHGGQRQTQVLEQFYDLRYDSIPWMQVQGSRSYRYPNGGGQVQINRCEIAVTPEKPWLTVRSVRVGLFLDRKLVAWAEPHTPVDSYIGWEGDVFTLPDLPLTLKPQDGDTLVCAAVVTDLYGREYVFSEYGGWTEIWDTGTNRITPNDSSSITPATPAGESPYSSFSTDGWQF